MLKVLARCYAFHDLKAQILDLITASEGISRQLYGRIENLNDSEMSGHRHLDEKPSDTYAGRDNRKAFLEELDRITETEAEKRQRDRKPPEDS